eukprot:GHVQ01009868.1.p1 GENE.GHVQ01009868.1~~GHVQ01009868.1.p1  ORF type:complete len:434 (-),score=80.83 GHVQ01009868.1:3139-4440(-)
MEDSASSPTSESEFRSKSEAISGTTTNEVTAVATGTGDSRKRKAVDSVSESHSNLSQDELRRLLSPLTREQMLSLLSEYCLVHSDLYGATFDLVQSSPASRRLMIRNIAFHTTDETFRSLFDALGDVEDCTIVKDRATGKSKGFGFVTFKDLESAGLALKQTFEMDGRTWAVKLASDSTGTDSTGSGSTGGRSKLFVRNLSDDTSDSRLQAEFSSFGAISEAVVVKDASSGKSKGYGFVTFSSSDDAGKALASGQRVIDGRMAFISLATPSSKGDQSQNSQHSSMSHYHAAPSQQMYAQQARPQYSQYQQPSQYSSVGMVGAIPSSAAGFQQQQQQQYNLMAAQQQQQQLYAAQMQQAAQQQGQQGAVAAQAAQQQAAGGAGGLPPPPPQRAGVPVGVAGMLQQPQYAYVTAVAPGGAGTLQQMSVGQMQPGM